MELKNLIDLIKYQDKYYQNPKAFNFLHKNKWQKLSNQEFYNDIKKSTLSLKNFGLKKDMGLGIIANSSPIWLIMNFAIISNRAFSVPIFANISKKNLLFQIQDANIKFFFCDSKENLDILLRSKVKFKKIITFGFKNRIKNENIIDFKELLKIGKDLEKNNEKSYENLVKKIQEDDIATIIYTSGSTGNPKGVEITHKNLITQIKSTKKTFPKINKDNIALSCLPLAHIFENMVINFYIYQGVTIYFADDPKNVGNLLKEVQPHVMTIVPRILEKTYSKINEKIANNSLIQRIIGNFALNFALKSNPNSKNILKCLFYWLVYRKISNSLGGNIKMLICGGAALNQDLEKFFNNIGVKIFTGYGLTETSPVIAVNNTKFNKIGTVGLPFPEVKVKIVDGELLTKSDCVMKGYHNNAEKTKAIITKDGWLKTGDLAVIENDGAIRIIGRKKELFKTAGGKYVSPVPIEQKLMQYCPFLSAALIIAEGKKFVSCLFFIDSEIIKSKIKNHQDKEKIIENDLKNIISKLNKELNQWERIRKFQVIFDELSIEGGEITPSMKLKRNIIEDKYQNLIDDIY
ncbi:long-chain fatty acid--CoA ligase [Rickettsiales bacterium]|nr:long-chain fatty acid--CoA ligase [Rickettsiales bacterium]